MSDGSVSWAAAIDTTDYDNGLKHIEDGTREAAANVEAESERLQSIFNDIPEINIQAVTNMPETADQIGEAYAEIARVQRINSEAINELNAEYARLTDQINKFQNVPQKRDEVANWKAERQAIKENISIREEMIAKTKELTKVVEQNEKEFAKHQKTQTSVKAQIKAVMNEMAALVDEAQRNGTVIDESTGRYRELAEELGRLKDIQGDVATQAKILSNDENQFQGIISGLTGLSGGFTAAQGAMALFGSENENLQKVMTQLQAVMAITMGLQQVQQMLNKDSAFRLVTLNSLRGLWNKLMGESNAVTAVNNAETTTNVAATEAQATATETATVAEEANTAARTANNTATRTGTAGTVANTTATEGATVAQNANTASLAAATTATKAATVATKLFRLAIASTGIGLLIIGIGALVSWVMELIGKEDEATKKAEELREINEEGAKAYAKAKGEISGYITKIEKFNGTQEEEKRLLKEVNGKYGEQFGYAKNLQEAKDKLSSKGEAYCRALEKEAIAQAYLNKYVEAHIRLLEIEDKAKRGEFDDKWYQFWNWGGKSSEQKREEAVKAAKDIADGYLGEYNKALLEAQQIRSEAGIGGYTDPNSTTKPKDSFDPKAAARQRKEAINQWKEAVKQYIKSANAEVTQANIDAMQDGLEKELAQIQAQTKAKKEAWEQHLLQLATAFKASEKAYYMAQKGHTEEGWEASDRGKMSVNDYAKELLNNPKNAELANQYYAQISQITETGEAKLNEVRKKYRDKWIKDYGSDLQKAELMQEEWNKRLAQVMAESPELYSAVYKAMEKDMASFDLSKFKMSINWNEVFGNLSEQSLQSLQYSLDKVKTYFAKAKADMTVTEIKDFQEAITAMENEIASRNPFTAMHKAFKDISTSKDELITSLNELATAQNELNAATEEANRLQQTKNELIETTRKSDQNNEMYALQQAQSKVLETERAYQTALQNRQKLEAEVSAGNLASNSVELASAIDAVTAAEKLRNEALAARNDAQTQITDQEAAEAAIQLVGVNEQLADSTTRLATAQTKNTNAEQRVITARNTLTKSYKQFATQLQAAGGVITDIGAKGKKLAQIFSDDVADSMEKSLDFIDEVLDATADVISSIGDVGKSVAKGMSSTVDAMGESTKATAAATATSISTVEKASVILTVISAALQIATAIASLFNNDDSKQKEIERLQERIDQLQWELDNADTVRLQNDTADAVKKLSECYRAAYDEVLRLNGVTRQTNLWVRYLTAATHSGEIYAKTIEKIADYWAQVDYTAGKALGNKKYEDSRKQLENLAEQQILIQKQINEENSKKKTDNGKVQDYKNQIAEITQQMADLINDMLEDIIGQSAEDLSKTLGDAFFDAVAQGEDAMKSWAKTTNELVADILKRMLITQYLEPEIGKIFDKYKKQWFGTDGSFKGIQSVIDSADSLANEINAVGETFAAQWDALSGSLGKWFQEDTDREGTSKGIATASQDSVDENNARLTTIQGHTYTLVQGMNELNQTANAMLDKLAGIEENTEETNNKLDSLDNKVKKVVDGVETITTNGIRLKQ